MNKNLKISKIYEYLFLTQAVLLFVMFFTTKVIVIFILGIACLIYSFEVRKTRISHNKEVDEYLEYIKKGTFKF